MSFYRLLHQDTGLRADWHALLTQWVPIKRLPPPPPTTQIRSVSQFIGDFRLSPPPSVTRGVPPYRRSSASLERNQAQRSAHIPLMFKIIDLLTIAAPGSARDTSRLHQHVCTCTHTHISSVNSFSCQVSYQASRCIATKHILKYAVSHGMNGS
jgi:hypothetical protein